VNELTWQNGETPLIEAINAGRTSDTIALLLNSTNVNSVDSVRKPICKIIFIPNSIFHKLYIFAHQCVPFSSDSSHSMTERTLPAGSGRGLPGYHHPSAGVWCGQRHRRCCCRCGHGLADAVTRHVWADPGAAGPRGRGGAAAHGCLRSCKLRAPTGREGQDCTLVPPLNHLSLLLY
jgi:hypothetical protein